jgi:hypothetical protein
MKQGPKTPKNLVLSGTDLWDKWSVCPVPGCGVKVPGPFVLCPKHAKEACDAAKKG